MKTILMQNAENIVVHGRTSPSRQPLTLFWSASGIEMNLKATQLWVEFETDYSNYEQWISVMLNGAHMARMMLSKGRSWLPLLRGMNPDQINHIEIVRDVQAMPNDPAACLQIHAIQTDGELLPVAPKQLKLEIIGDSITSSEGAIGSMEETEWIAMWFCAVKGYAYKTAQQLNADLRVLSQSGWGVLTSWDNDPHCALPLYYEQVCGVLKGEKNTALGAMESNDFQAWNADVVVINLGTNDYSAFSQPAWTDPETGAQYKQRTQADGTLNNEDFQKLCDAVYHFVAKVRKYNPNAYILWVHGMLGAPLKEALSDVIAAYRDDTGDARVEFMLLPDMQPDGVGARSHPGELSHERAAAVLTEKIRSL